MRSQSAAATVAIVNERGLHARAAAKFVKIAGKFDAEVTVGYEGTTVPGISIMGLLMLAAGRGSAVEIRAEGRQAMAAVKALAALVADGFGED